MKNTLRRHPVAVALYLMLGLFLGAIAPDLIPGARSWFDMTFRPVVVMSGRLVDVSEQQALVRIAGEKRRSCDFAGISAYALDPAGFGRDVKLSRADGIPQDGHTKPTGNFDLGVWRIDGIGHAVRAQVWVTHFCQGRRVVTKIADVALDRAAAD